MRAMTVEREELLTTACRNGEGPVAVRMRPRLPWVVASLPSRWPRCMLGISVSHVLHVSSSSCRQRGHSRQLMCYVT